MSDPFKTDPAVKILLENNLSDLDIAEIITNLFMSMRMEKISFKNFLEYLRIIVDKAKTRTSAVIPAVMKKYYKYFYYIVKNQKAVNDYNVVITEYIKNILEKIGLEYSDDDDVDTIVSRNSAVKLAYLVGIPEYVEYFKKLFIQYQEGKSIIEPNIKNTVFKSVLINGTIEERSKSFQFLKQHNEKSSNPTFVLTKSPDLDNYLEALDLVFSDKLKKDDKIDFLVTAGKNKMLSSYLWTFMKENWDYIYEIVENTSIPFTNMVEIFDVMVDHNGLREDIKSFIVNKNVKRYQKPLNAILEQITINTNFNNLFQ